VFTAHTPDGDVLDARVLVDEKVVATRLDGIAVEIDPGVHRIHFEVAGRPPIELTVVLVEGQKNRVVEATWRDEPPPVPVVPGPAVPQEPPPPPVPVEVTRPVPVLTYVLGGVGVAGLASFTAFALV